MKIINIRKLVALDVALNGWVPISAEAFFEVFGIMIIGILFFETTIGFYFFLLSFNFIPALVYVLLIGNRENAKKEVRAELSKVKRYGSKAIRNYNLQQLLAFIPFSIIILSVLQEIQK